MQCPKCESKASVWKWVRDTPRPYRVTCKKCGFFIKWGNTPEWIEEVGLNSGSVKIEREIHDVDVSDLFK